MRIDHMAVYVEDIEGAREFFVRYFKARAGEMFTNEANGFCLYFLEFDGGGRIELMKRRGIADFGGKDIRAGYAHIALGAVSRENVNALTERLRSDGFAVLGEPRVTGDGYYESVICGFEGNIIEITV